MRRYAGRNESALHHLKLNTCRIDSRYFVFFSKQALLLPATRLYGHHPTCDLQSGEGGHVQLAGPGGQCKANGVHGVGLRQFDVPGVQVLNMVFGLAPLLFLLFEYWSYGLMIYIICFMTAL